MANKNGSQWSRDSLIEELQYGTVDGSTGKYVPVYDELVACGPMVRTLRPPMRWAR